ncbi:metalloproteinase inhibitor 3-like isoform X1 [Mytilus californianus]|uniref:metalloproteinase inhibitor 3-like isoform X1 n=1 Tax=Mytilus californianus TaxID=6549 RepID=UPI0022465395|nr:metalloproteinase inhibitor 3-like isoform X1 [Mytilus californianus]XP_052084390.1 metalloproteinase inhibitor 3-like isoform X1 [Mytilus californianus]
MRTMRIYSIFLLICLFAMSEQCGCPAPYTQQIVCYDPIVVEAKIESFSERGYDKNYQITVTKFYKGKGEYDTLSDKTTLKTPKEASACGPVVLKVGSTYILSVSVYDGKMQHNLCGLQVDASSATNTLLEGIAGKYQENCDCGIPSMYEPPQRGPRTNKQCGHSPLACDNYDTICAKDGNDQCNWQNC